MNLGIILIISLATFIIQINTYRILGIFPFPFKSHSIFQHALMKGLTNKGHQIDIISYNSLPNPPKNYKTILNLTNINYNHTKGKFNSIQEVIERNRNILSVTKDELGLNLCNIISHEKIQKLIKNPPKNPPYDVFITQGTSSNCFYAFGAILNVPVVSISPGLEFSLQTRIMGSPLCSSFYQTTLNTKSNIKTFWDRLGNTVQAITDMYKLKFYTENQSEAIKKYLNPNISSVREVEKLVSLFIVNTHFSIHGVRPKVPGLIEIGGIHIEDDASLTPDLKKLMDESTSGVILFSFGSSVPVESLPKETIAAIFSSFRKLAPIKILIKATAGYEFPFELPKNVLKMTWIPQISILKHENTRLFISHGGVHSIIETINFGIPVIGIPLHYDQHQNVQIVVNKGMGLELAIDEITEESLDQALTMILNDSKFREAAKYASQVFRDRPMSPVDTAIYWIEYVIKNGANSLRSPAVDMYWWQSDQLDVYAVFLFFFTLVFYTIKIMLSQCK